MADELAYCEECLKQPSVEQELDFYDWRFDRPVCRKCVEKNNLTPESED